MRTWLWKSWKRMKMNLMRKMRKLLKCTGESSMQNLALMKIGGFFFYMLLDIVDKRTDVVRPDDWKSGLWFWSLVELLSVFNRITGFKFGVLYLQPSFAEIMCTCWVHGWGFWELWKSPPRFLNFCMNEIKVLQIYIITVLVFHYLFLSTISRGFCHLVW